LEQAPRLRVGTPEQLDDQPGDTLYEVNVEEAKVGLEWNGIEFDTQYVIDATNLLMEMVRHKPEEGEETSGVREYPVSFSDDRDRTHDIITRSLWESALVTYARCFGTGKRVRLDESVFDGQPEGTLRWHKYFKHTRDKHVAHSVYPFEFGHFGVRLAGRGTDNVRVTGEGGFVYLYRGGEALTTIEVLNWLAKLVNRYAMKRRNEAGQRALDRATAMSKEQLNALPVLQASPEDGFDAAGKARR
jgi:hypothetical protein